MWREAQENGNPFCLLRRGDIRASEGRRLRWEVVSPTCGRMQGGEFLPGTLESTFKPQLWAERDMNNIGVSSTRENREGYGPRGQVMDDRRLR